MIRRWLLYALAVLGAVLFRVVYTDWLAGFVLRLVLCFPLLGVLTALPCVLTCRLSLTADRDRAERRGTVRWRIEGKSALGLPLGRVRLTVESVNALYGLTLRQRETGFFPGGGGKIELAAPTDHCGLLTGRICHAWALDGLGLFWLPLRREKEARLWVTPVPVEVDLERLPQEEAPGVRPRPGGGPGEDYDPREYRPGDPLNTIHWKLSAKRDELVTRETLETVSSPLALTFDCYGRPEELDRTLEALTGTAQALLKAGRAHTVAWADAITGELRRFPVGGEEELDRCLEAILSRRVPKAGRSVLDLRGLERTLHVTALPAEERGGGEQ